MLAGGCLANFDLVEVLNGAILCASRPPVELRRLQFLREALGPDDVHLSGLDERIYREPAKDLVALREEIYDDPISAFIARYIIPKVNKLLFKLRKSRKESKVRKWSGAAIKKVASIFWTAGSTAYLLAAIMTLYHTPGVTSRLWIIAGFSMLHALMLSLLSSLNVESLNSIST